MNKRKKGRTLSRTKDQRLALLRTLFVSLVKFKKIETTTAKAKELKPFAERLVTRAKRGLSAETAPAAIRMLKKDLPISCIKQLMEMAEGLKERQGGYLRIVKLPARKSDNAEMSLVEWVDGFDKQEEKEVEDKKEEKKKDVKKEKSVEKKEDKQEEAKADKK